MRDDVDDNLSPAGDRRRAAILTMALATARRRRTRRRAARVGGGLAAVAAVAAVAVSVWLGAVPNRPAVPPVVAVTAEPEPRLTPVPERPVVVAPPAVTVGQIDTDPTIADRLALRPGRPRWVMLDDAGLVRELAVAGRPGGVVRINGEVRLLLRDQPVLP